MSLHCSPKELNETEIQLGFAAQGMLYIGIKFFIEEVQ
jgi:hypothetical protein